MNEHARTHDHEHGIDPALSAMEARLARLGAADRDSAPASLEERLFVRTRGLLPREVNANQAAAYSEPLRMPAPPLAARWRIAAAAGLVVAGVLTGLLLTQTKALTSSNGALASNDAMSLQLETVDARLATESAWDGGLGDELAAFDQEMAALESGASTFWNESSAVDEIDGINDGITSTGGSL